jgi:hypothetical protein
VVLDVVLRRAFDPRDAYELRRRLSSRHPAVTLSFLAYADDIALLTPDPVAAQRALTRLHQEAVKVGLHISASKTEVMHIGIQQPTDLQLPTGENIAQCDEFVYLGAKIMNVDDLVRQRRCLAWVAAKKLSGVFNSDVSDSIKLGLFKAIVESVLSYGLETVPMPKSRAATLDAAHRSLLRFALGIHYPNVISNSDLVARAPTTTFGEILRRRRLALIGHTARATRRDTPTPLALAFMHPAADPFRRGMGRLVTLPATFMKDLNSIGVTFNDVAGMTKDRYRSLYI